MPERLFLVGHAGSGKTQLMEQLIEGLCARGWRVACLKHSPHVHELDKPGKDSHRHRMAGGRLSGVISQGLAAVFVPLKEGEDGFERLAPLYADCDILLVEGHKKAFGRKLEVYRAELGHAPLAASEEGFWAVVSDDSLEVDVPVWPRSDVDGLLGRVEDLLR